MENKFFHKSVLYDEALAALKIKDGENYIDATLGGGGHTEGILNLGGRVLGLDVDPDAVKFVANCAKLAVKKIGKRVYAKNDKLTLIQGNFSNLAEIAYEFGFQEVSGVLFDLGVSSYQLQDRRRGFSFSGSGPLDMRMDPELKVTAADLINGLNQGELYELFNKYGEERRSRHIACAIVESRLKKKIETTLELAAIIERATGKRGKLHPATKVFQALRIAVNDEISNLKNGLDEAAGLLRIGGRLVVISFHSLEDRVVKDFFRKRVDLQVLTKKPTVPTREEIFKNHRSRSAKMRTVERI